MLLFNTHTQLYTLIISVCSMGRKKLPDGERKSKAQYRRRDARDEAQWRRWGRLPSTRLRPLRKKRDEPKARLEGCNEALQAAQEPPGSHPQTLVAARSAKAVLPRQEGGHCCGSGWTTVQSRTPAPDAPSSPPSSHAVTGAAHLLHRTSRCVNVGLADNR